MHKKIYSNVHFKVHIYTHTYMFNTKKCLNLLLIFYHYMFYKADTHQALLKSSCAINGLLNGMYVL